MKYILLLCFGALLFASCGKDSCSSDTFVGTWKGTKSCALGGSSSQNVTIVVTKSGDNLIFDGDLFSDVSMERDDCSVEGGVSLLGSGEKYTGSVSEDGKTMNLAYEITTLSLPVTSCTFSLTK